MCYKPILSNFQILTLEDKLRNACEKLAWKSIGHYRNRLTMSLFKVRDCWSTICGRGETFGCDALAVDDLFDAGEDNVILGSLNGVLRIYGVHAAPPPDLRYSPSDLLVEVQKESPILQVCTGKLIRSVLNEILKKKRIRILCANLGHFDVVNTKYVEI